MFPLTFSPTLRSGSDAVERGLTVITQYVLIAVGACVPWLFIPGVSLSPNYTKIALVTGVSVLLLLVIALRTLRTGTLQINAWSVVGVWWLIALWGVVSALLSGDWRDGIWGENFSIHTVSFFALLALITTLVASVFEQKRLVMQFLAVFGGSSFVLLLWQTVRFFFGPEILTLGTFTTATSTPVGSFNDLAIFAGAVIIVTILAIVQLPLRRAILWLSAIPLITALVVLAVVNFFLVWVVVGFFALMSLLYVLAKDRLFRSATSVASSTSDHTSWFSVVLLSVVCAVTALFIVGGSLIGPRLGTALGIQYLEVRPSFMTTLTVMRDAYADDHALFGVGPQRFAEAWREYKNPVINETLFWNTAFSSGSSYILTMFITTGVVGGVLILWWCGAIVRTGYRALSRGDGADRLWYFVATVSLALVMYIWILALLYVPGPTLLLLGAFFAGLLVAAYAQLVPGQAYTWSCLEARPRALMLIAGVVVVIVGGVAVLYMIGAHVIAHLQYAKAYDGATTDALARNALLENAYSSYPNDRFLADRVELYLGLLRGLLDVESPTPADLERFNAALVEARKLAISAVAVDNTEPRNELLLASVYGMWAVAGATTTARELAAASFARAQALDPHNPEYAVVEAQLALRLGEVEQARRLIDAALTKKSNYVDALYLRSQIAALEGNTDQALAAAQSVVALEPQNPARHFQFGVLSLSSGNRDAARQSFETAVALDPVFANARYLLALIYLEDGRRDDARALLQAVSETNPENAELQAIIAALDSGATTLPMLDPGTPVAEPSVVSETDGVATSPVAPETDLIVPVNPPPNSDTEAADTERTESAAASSTNPAP
jgi:tetratricopeptide (TPR) repeat protein